VKRNPFVITATHFGPMLANRYDYFRRPNGDGWRGVGVDLMETGEYFRQEIDDCFDVIRSRREKFGDGVVVLDVGANIGTHTIAWAIRMHGWGEVYAIEAQERIYYALCGNITMNNCFNARAMWAAAAAQSGIMVVPIVDHQKPANFGGLSLNGWGRYDQPPSVGEVEITAAAIDDFKLPRLDFIKIDVQGMELDVLKGARETIERCYPVIVAENNFAIDDYAAAVGDGYACRVFDGMNVIMEPLKAMEKAA